ncbi:MAG: hypothetical protein HKN77_09910 [Woeseiaceae bacterium]|nr:hypothetical protein [Woeseiaceae bacterium]
MNEIIESLVGLAWRISIVGNLLVAILCLLRGKRRGLVVGLTLGYVGGCLATVFVLAVNFFHGLPPAYASWILSVLALVGVVLFAFLLRIAVTDDGGMRPAGK